MIRRGLLVLGAVAVSCTTNVTDDSPLPSGSSVILGSAPATAAILVDDTQVVWFTPEGAGSPSTIASCPKTGCQSPTILTTHASVATGFAWQGSPAVIAQGTAYYVVGNVSAGMQLQTCPLTGCEEPGVLASTETSTVVTDGNWLAYDDSNAGLSVCALPQCEPHAALKTGAASSAGASFALANGVLYYLESTSTVDPTSGNAETLQTLESCPANACPNGRQTLWQGPSLSEGDQPQFSGILGADSGSVFLVGLVDDVTGSDELMRCDLPSCATPADMGSIADPDSTIRFAGSDLFVASHYGSSWMHCTRESCDSTALTSPDPVLASLCAPTTYDPSQPFGALPFAVDATSFYWATSTIYKTPGNLIASTPR